LQRAGVRIEECTFEMVAIGPIWREEVDFDSHRLVRDQMAELERAIADDLRDHEYAVLDTHPRAGNPDQSVLHQLRTPARSQVPCPRKFERKK